MNKEDSPVKVIQGWTDPDIDMHPGRLSMSLLLRANANPGDVPCGVVIGSKAIPEGAVVKIREKADKWDELRKNLDFYESGVDENGNGIEDKNLKDLLVRTVEKVVFAHWETTPRK